MQVSDLGIPTLNQAKNSADEARSTSSLGQTKDQFLQLLLATIKHQDPLAPQDAEKFSEQMTQFGQLEQLFNLNDSVSGMNTSLTASAKYQALGLIGKSASVATDVLQHQEGVPVSLQYQLNQSAKKVKVDVLNNAGISVRSLELENQGAGVKSVDFDGLATDGTSLGTGTYKIKVTAVNDAGKEFSGMPIVKGPITGVEFNDYAQIVNVAGQPYLMDQVISIHE
jgi:flagellar basal-body rod modification protein FlgD